jgi:tetratricopeptide (TPR) repeat protein
VRRLLLLTLAAFAAAAPAAAQRGGNRSNIAPNRPPLGAAADSNSAVAYYMHGVNVIERAPAEAAASFYWASRLNPGWADALYGEYVARLMTDKDRLVDYMRGQRGVLRSREIQHIDSLYAQARTIDPFLVRRFDNTFLHTWLQTWAENEVRREDPTGVNPAAIAHWIDTELLRNDDELQAWMAVSEGRNASALTAYGRAIQQARHRSGLRAELARVHYQMGNYDQAVATMQQAITEWRKEDGEDRIIILYQSKAVLEHSIGVLQEAKHDPAAAREAYGRALQEDIAYYPAHVRLSMLALAAGDTTSAISEMDLAVQIRGDEPSLRMGYGRLLAAARKYEDAEQQFKKAVELDPDYAAPYFVLARLYDGSGMRQDAIDNYRGFLAHAGRSEAQLEPARQRMEQLASEAASETQSATGATPAAQPAGAAPAPTPAAQPATPPPAPEHHR